jgi:hypothetical protein
MSGYTFTASNRPPVEVRASELLAGDLFLWPDGRLSRVESVRTVARRVVRVRFYDGRFADLPGLDLVNILGAEVGTAVKAEYIPAHPANREPGVLL